MSRARLGAWGLAATVAALALMPSTAVANGPCGGDYDGATACSLSFPATISGSLVTDNESDYYVFTAPKGTELFVTATDTEQPTCTSASDPVSCGSVEADLYDSQGNSIGESTGSSSPNNNITVPRSFSTTIQSTGTYYLIVSGGLGRDTNSNPTQVPYSLQVSSLAGGPCGTDFDGATACPVNSPASLSGDLVTDNESDYYVFYATKGAELSVTATDTEEPTCTSASDPVSCGNVEADLYDSQGNSVGESTGSSSPNNNITVPRLFSTTIQSTGAYYLVVSGGLGRDADSNPSAVPYALQVSSSPNVLWPPPGSVTQPKHPTAPACVVPSFKRGAKLSSVKRRLTAAHCTVGAIRRAHNRRVRRGRVTALSPRPRTRLAANAAVSITVSSGRRHKRNRH
jgi:hypothetical protein